MTLYAVYSGSVGPRAELIWWGGHGLIGYQRFTGSYAMWVVGGWRVLCLFFWVLITCVLYDKINNKALPWDAVTPGL